MNINVGGLDRTIRIIAGIVLLSLIVLIDSPWRWLGLLGLLPLITGLTRRCPGYSILGVNTNRPPPGPSTPPSTDH